MLSPAVGFVTYDAVDAVFAPAALMVPPVAR